MRCFRFKAVLAGAFCAILTHGSLVACESAEPAEAFVYANDTNLDGVLDIKEWREATISDNFVVNFKDFSDAEFKRLDRNGNKKLEWDKDKLYEEIDYVKDPCEAFYENLENNETK